MFADKEIEEWKFEFGFVPPNMTVSWENTIEAAGGDQMLPAEILSGNMVIATILFDGDFVINKMKIRVNYV